MSVDCVASIAMVSGGERRLPAPVAHQPPRRRRPIARKQNARNAWRNFQTIPYITLRDFFLSIVNV